MQTLRKVNAGDAVLTDLDMKEVASRILNLDRSKLSRSGRVLGRTRNLVKMASMTDAEGLKPVAVKVMIDNEHTRNEVFVSMVVSERCKRVCPTYGAVAGVETYKLWMVMDRCWGSLERVVREGPLKEVALAKATDDICKAVMEMHEQGLVHCDIKPPNCLITRDGTVVLCDFGSVKVGSSLTCSNVRSRASGDHTNTISAFSTQHVKEGTLPKTALEMTHLYAPLDQMKNMDPGVAGTKRFRGQQLH